MAETPKTLRILLRKANTVADAKDILNELLRELDRYLRINRADIEKIEKRLDDGGL